MVFAGASGVYSQDNANFFWNDSTHYLGIGTATPFTLLTLQGVGDPTITINNSSGANKAFIGVVGTAGDFATGSSAGDFFVRGQQNLFLVANAAGTPNLMIQSSTGNVGIGTTSPGVLLDVNGNTRIYSNFKYLVENICRMAVARL